MTQQATMAAQPATLATLVSGTTLAQPATLATLVSGTTLYAQMDAAGIPAPILDHIGHQVHRMRFNDGLKAALEDPRTPFERSCDADLSLAAMIQTHQIEPFLDTWCDWLTVVFYVPATRTYIVYYHYDEIPGNKVFLMEIAIEKCTTMRLVRFYGKQLYRSHMYSTFDAYRAAGGMDWIPFQFLAQSNIACIPECTDGSAEMFSFRTDTCREWRDAERTLEWFEANEHAFYEMARQKNRR